jgi:hypothetical protein
VAAEIPIQKIKTVGSSNINTPASTSLEYDNCKKRPIPQLVSPQKRRKKRRKRGGERSLPVQQLNHPECSREKRRPPAIILTAGKSLLPGVDKTTVTKTLYIAEHGSRGSNNYA